MIRFSTCLILSAIVLFFIYNFHCNSQYYKNLYNEIVSTKAWGRIEIVDEKTAYEDISWDTIDLFVGIIIGVTVCFTIGLSVNYYCRVYDKPNMILDDCLRKQALLEKKVDHLKEKLQAFEKRYSVELIYKRNSEDTLFLETKDAYQQVALEGVDRSSQTSCPESNTSLGACKEIDVDPVIDEMEFQASTCILSHPEAPKSDKQEDSLNSEVKNEDLYNEHHLEEKDNLIEVQEYHSNDPSFECDILSYVEEHCPIEIDVQYVSESDSKEIHDDEPERDIPAVELKQSMTVVDIVQTVPDGTGESEETPGKVKMCRRIPQYQGLRKGSDQKNKENREQVAVEDEIPLIMNQIPEIIEIGKPIRTSTPRKYSVSADTVDHTTHGGRKRKQKTYCGK